MHEWYSLDELCKLSRLILEQSWELVDESKDAITRSQKVSRDIESRVLERYRKGI